jgi:hypothetical protein
MVANLKVVLLVGLVAACGHNKYSGPPLCDGGPLGPGNPALPGVGQCLCTDGGCSCSVVDGDCALLGADNCSLSCSTSLPFQTSNAECGASCGDDCMLDVSDGFVDFVGSCGSNCHATIASHGFQLTVGARSNVSLALGAIGVVFCEGACTVTGCDPGSCSPPPSGLDFCGVACQVQCDGTIAPFVGTTWTCE